MLDQHDRLELAQAALKRGRLSIALPVNGTNIREWSKTNGGPDDFFGFEEKFKHWVTQNDENLRKTIYKSGCDVFVLMTPLEAKEHYSRPDTGKPRARTH